MASFPANLFTSLPSLSPTGQQLLVANNLRGISDSERAAFKALILKNDPRMLASVEAFQMDRDVYGLVNYWRSLELDEEDAGNELGRLSREAVVGLLDGVYRKLSATGGAESRALANRAAAEFFSAYESRDGKASLEDLQAWLSAEPPAAKPRKPHFDPPRVAPRPPSRDESKPIKITPSPKATDIPRFTPQVKAEPRPEPKPEPLLPEPIAEEPVAPKKPAPKANPMHRLTELRDDAGLSNVSPVQIVDRVKALFGKKDDITEAEFVDIMMELGKKYSGARRDSKATALHEIFLLMDINKSQTLDREELINALTAITGGSEEDKIAAVFMLYDVNGDGLISFEEMQRHQVAVFRMAYALNPALRKQMGAGPEALAAITTESVFKELDADKNNVISLDEFKAWYSGETPSEEVKSARFQRTDALTSQRAQTSVPVFNPTSSLDSLKETIEGLGLTGVHVADAMSVFKEHGAGIFSRQQFKDTLKTVIQQYGNAAKLKDAEFNQVCADLFLTFDTDQSATVDMQELFSGLSVLCEGTPGEKLRVAFDLYDESGDGFIQYQELTKYLGAVFRMVLKRQGQTAGNVEELAQATARDCFTANDQNVDSGKLTFVQFKEWHDGIGIRI